MRIIKLLLIIIILLVFNSGCSNGKYEQAEKLMSQNKFDEAIELLNTIPDNEKAKGILEKEQKYKEAVNLYHDNKFDESLELFKQTTNYRDTNDMVDDIIKRIEDKKEKIYIKAKQLYNLNELDLARGYFENIGVYKDSESILKVIIEKEDEQYREALNLVKEKNFDEALVIFKKIASYKNTPIIRAYISAEKYYLEREGSIYRKYQKAQLFKFLIQIPKDYSGDLYEIINEFKIEISEKINDDSKITEEILQLISKKKYMEASWLINDYINECDDYDVLDKFVSALSWEQDKEYDMIKYELTRINPEYDGILSEEINKFALKYMTMDEWKGEYSSRKISIQQQKEESKELKPKQSPKIGMTAEEVENSTWGKPKKINKTTTEYGVSEQWVYSLDKYIYFDDGIVTAIQESE